MKKLFVSIAACAVTASLSSAVALAEDAKATPTPEHKRLEFFVGKHTIDGKMLPNGPAFQADETCEWFEGRFAVVCKGASAGGEKSLSILSYSPEQKSYGYYSISSTGMVAGQRGRIEGDTWTFAPEGTGAPKMRFLVKPTATGYRLTIEVDNNGKWLLVEDTTYTKK